MAPRQPRDGPPHERAPRQVPGVLRAGRRRVGLARALRAGGGGGERRRSRARGRALPGAADGDRAAAGGGDAVIPLRDDVPSRSVPLVTIALIVLNVVVYLYEVSLGVGGAVSGGLGAYRLLFPSASILALVGFAFFWRFVHVPAMVMIGVWILMQLILGYLTVSASTGGAEIGGVAWFAHIGGFLTGVVLLFLLRPRRSARS